MRHGQDLQVVGKERKELSVSWEGQHGFVEKWDLCPTLMDGEE